MNQALTSNPLRLTIFARRAIAPRWNRSWPVTEIVQVWPLVALSRLNHFGSA